MRALVLPLVLPALLTACGQSEDAPPLAPEPGSATTPPVETPELSPAPEETAEAPEPPPRAGRVPVVVLPDPVPVLPTVRTRRHTLRVSEDSWGEDGMYPSIELPEAPDTAARVNAQLRARAAGDPDYPGSCRTVFANDKLLSLLCEFTEVYERGGSDVYVEVKTFAVSEDGLAEVHLENMISPTGNFDAKIRSACAATLRREGVEADDAEEGCRGVVGNFDHSARLSPRGVVGSVYHDDFDEMLSFTLPFRELDRAVYADTPLGAALAALPGASVEDIELPPGTVRAGQTASGVVFGAPGRAGSVLGRWFHIAPADRPGLVLAGADHHFRLARPANAEGTGAIEGDPGEEAEWSTALLPRLVRTRVETSFRSRPEERNRALILPRGTILAVGLGRVGATSSAMGRRGTWALTAAAPGVFGYTAGALLEPYEGCEPDAEPFLRELPEDYRETAEASVVRALIDVRERGRTHAAVAYGGAGRRNTHRRLGVSRVELYERPEEGSCALGERITRLDLEGNLYAMRFTTTTAHGGHTLILTGAYLRPGRLRWQLFDLRQSEPLWSWTGPRQAEVMTEEMVDDEYIPVVIDSSGTRRLLRFLDGAIDVEETRTP